MIDCVTKATVSAGGEQSQLGRSLSIKKNQLMCCISADSNHANQKSCRDRITSWEPPNTFMLTYLLPTYLLSKKVDRTVTCLQWRDWSKVSKTVSKYDLPLNPVRPNLWDWVRLRGCRSKPCCGDHGVPRHPLILINGILTSLRVRLICCSGWRFLSTSSWANQWVDDEARILPM